MPALRSRPLGPDEPLFFLHIPKTAGTTFNAILQQQFHTGDVCPPHFIPEFLALPEAQRAGYRLYRGHYTYNLYQHLAHQPVYMTVLRSPVERVLSHVSHTARAPAADNHDLYHQLPLDAYLRHLNVRYDSENLQTRMLSPRADEGLSRVYRPLDRTDLERAKERLTEMACVGVTEQFRGFLDLVTYMFVWNPVNEIIAQNVGRNRLRAEAMPPTTLELISEMNQLDLELHAFATTLFEARYRSMVGGLLGQRYRERLEATTTVYSRDVRVDFQTPMPGRGWYGYEHPHGGMRWTGPEAESSLLLPLEREQPLRIRFRVVAMLLAEIVDTVRLLVNGTEVELARSLDDNNHWIFTGVIPVSALARADSLSELTWRVGKTVSPIETGLNDIDTRRLGIAVNLIEIMPAPEAEPV